MRICKKINIITNANREIGFGHLVRQIQLAKFLKKSGIDPCLISLSDEATKFCEKNDVPAISFEKELTDLQTIVSNFPLIIDVHEENFPAFRFLESTVPVLILVVSEIGHPFDYFGDHVIRMGSDLQFWDKNEEYKRGDKKILVHSGRAWMIFKDEFNGVNKKIQKKDNTILIAHGGSDPYKLTFRSLRALKLTQGKYHIYILATDNFADLNRIKEEAELSPHKVEVILNAKEPEVWMRKASVAIINGGNIRYEVCLTHTPFIAISFREIQYLCTEQISSEGIGLNIGVFNKISNVEIANSTERLLLDSDLRKKMTEKMEELFDFEGPSRIVKLIN